MASTLKSIAQATGYSVTTVSRALAGYDDVNKQTRLLILEEAKRQGYHPNLYARQLKGQGSLTVGLIMPTLGPRFSDPFFSEFVAGVGNTVATEGYDLLLSTHAPSAPGELELYRRMVAGRRVDGLIVVRTRQSDPRITYLQEIQMPFVVFGRTDNHKSYLYVDTDGTAGQYNLTQHFIDLGHRDIAYITPPANLMFTRYRLQGYRQAMTDHDLPVNEDYIVEGHELTEQSGHEAANDLFKLARVPTAIMTGNDLMALGVMTAARQHSLQVGLDVAIGGFDDIPTAEHVNPGLTTLRQPIYQVGQQLASALLDMIANKPVEHESALLLPKLIIRGSSGPRRNP